MNLPNKLTLARIIMTPGVIALIMLSGELIPAGPANIAAAVLFSLVSLTDYLDGKIARERNLVTSFGKFLDPLADKLLVIGTLLAILYRAGDATRPYIFWGLLIVVFRELIVTGLRLIAVSEGGEVIAASRLGKLKTVTQIVCILVLLLEPVVGGLLESLNGSSFVAANLPFSIFTILLMALFTLWSGAAYIVKYKGYLKQ